MVAPLRDLGHVDAVLPYIGAVIEQPVAQQLLHMAGLITQTRYTVNRIGCETTAVKPVEHRHVERGGGGSLLPIAVHMETVVIRALVDQPMDDPWITMKGEDHRLVAGEDGIEQRRTVRAGAPPVIAASTDPPR